MEILNSQKDLKCFKELNEKFYSFNKIIHIFVLDIIILLTLVLIYMNIYYNINFSFYFIKFIKSNS